MNLYNNMDRKKVQFDFVVTPEERKDLYEQVEKMGGRIFVCPKYTGKNHFAYCKWWDSFFKEHPEYHVIHGHVRSTASIYLKIAKKNGLVTIAHSHSTSNGSGISAIVKDMLRIFRESLELLPQQRIWCDCNRLTQQWLQSNFRVFIWNRMKGQEDESIYIAPRRCLRLYGR